MTPKEKISAFVQKFDDRASMEEVLDKLELFRDVEIGLTQFEQGKFVEHEELFERLLNEDANLLVRACREKSPGNKKNHRSRRPQTSTRLHKETKESRR